MAKSDNTTTTNPEAVISIIGKGMTLTGDCETDGALRIEGTVKGDVHAGKAVVIGKEGLVDGNIYTQDAVISGHVLGAVHAQSRLELQATGRISGEIVALRMHLEEGATVHGQVAVGETPKGKDAGETSKDADETSKDASKPRVTASPAAGRSDGGAVAQGGDTRVADSATTGAVPHAVGPSRGSLRAESASTPPPRAP